MGGFSVYGLGILLTLEDKVSDKIGGVSNSIQNLSTKAMSLNYMGKSLMSTGKALLSPLTGLSKEIIRVGDDVEKSRITFGALYEDATLGAEKFNEVIKYAAKTPFDVESLKDAALQFKTLGVEIFGEKAMVTDATGETRQLIDIIGDAGAGLSGVARNGFKDVVYATREFITEGNKLSFLRRLGIDIDSVLAKGIKADNVMKEMSLSAGKTVEERKVAYANLIKALNMDGLMGKMEGTWSQVMSNMGDIWYLFMMKIGDKGSFKVFTEAFKGISDTMKALLDTDIADRFCDSVSKALESVIRPLDLGVKKLMEFTARFIQIGAEHPEILKVAFSVTALAGGLFMLAGAGLIAQSSILVLGHGLAVIASIIPRLLLLAGIFALVRTAWTKDIGGIRTRITEFVNTVKSSFSNAKEILALNSDEMIQKYNELVSTFSQTGDFGAGLTAGIIRVRTLWGAFVDFWNDSTLSQENLKILNDMGLMPMFEKIALWTERIKAFFKGVTEGFSEMVNTIGDFVKKVTSKLFPTLDVGKSGGLFDMITGKFNGGDMSNIQEMGKTAIKLLPTVLGLIKIAKVLHKHRKTGVGGGIANLFSRILGGTGRRSGSGLIPALRRLGTTLSMLNPVEILRGMRNLAIIVGGLSLLAMAVGGIASINPAVFLTGSLAISALTLTLVPLSTPMFDLAVDSLTKISKFKPKTFLKGIENLAIIMGSLSLLSMAIGLVTAISPKAMLAGIGVFALLGVALTPIASPSFMGAVKSLQGLAKFKPTTILKGMGNLAIIFGALSAMLLVIGLISLIPFDIGRVAKLTGIIAELGLIGAALTKFDLSIANMKPTVVLRGLGNMAIALGGMMALLTILALISKIDFSVDKLNGMIDVIKSLGKVGTVLSVLFGVIGAIEILSKGYAVGAIAAGLGTIAVVMTVMAGLLALLNRITVNLDVGRLNKIIKVIGMVGLIGSALSVLTGISSVFLLPAIVGLITIGIVVEGLAHLAVLFSKLESKADKIQSGLKVMSMIGEGIGEALGSVVGGFGKGMTSTLPAMATDIKTFFDTIAPIFNIQGIENVQKIGDAMSSLGKGLMSLTKSNILSGFSGLSGLGTELDEFAHLTQSAFNCFSEYTDKGFTNASKVFETLNGMGKFAFRSNGLAQIFTGKVDLKRIGKQLDGFSHSAQEAFKRFSKYPNSGIEKAPKILGALEHIAKYDFKTGGFFQHFTGEMDLKVIGKQLDKFAHSAQSAFNCFSEFPEEGIKKAPEVFKAISGMGDYDLKSGGLAQLFTGKTSLQKFGSELDSFAHSLQSAFNCFSEFSDAGTTAGMAKLPEILNLISNIPQINADNFSGLPTLGQNLDTFAHLAQSAFNCFSEFTPEGFTNISNLATALSDLSSKMANVVVPSINDISTSLSYVGGLLTFLIEDFTSLGTAAANASTQISTSATTISTSLSTLVSVSTDSANAFVYAMAFMTYGMQTAAYLVIDSMMMMCSGVQSGCSLVVSAVAAMCSMVQGQLAALAASGYSYGSQLASNIAAGISANSGVIAGAVQRAVSNAMSNINISVPSVTIGHCAAGTSNWTGGLTEINERGGEIVDLPRGTRIYPHDDSVTMAFDDGMRTAIENMRGKNDNRQYDNSVYFSAGSIVVQVANASEAEAERFAELVIKKIEKRKRRKAIATYAY